MIDLRRALRLYLVADPDHCEGDLVVRVEEALRGGVTIVQLRAKTLNDRETVQLARELAQRSHHHEVPILVNDRIDIAIAAEADGIHLGVDDLPLEAARMQCPPGFIIGYSPDTDAQLEAAAVRGADYLGIGPVFATSTKSDAGTALGLTELAHKVRRTSLPVVGIGGIGIGDVAPVLATGACGVAVVSAILQAPDAEAAARQLSRNSNSSSTRGSVAGSQ